MLDPNDCRATALEYDEWLERQSRPERRRPAPRAATALDHSLRYTLSDQMLYEGSLST